MRVHNQLTRRYYDDSGRSLQRARWVWMTQPEVASMVETMVKPLLDNSDFYFKAFAHKHRNKLAGATAGWSVGCGVWGWMYWYLF